MNALAAVRKASCVWLWAPLVGCVGVAAGAEQPGITVSGTGVAEAMPDSVMLSATVEGNAELAGDAVEKFRSTKRRVAGALAGLDIEGITVSGAGMSVNSGTPVNPRTVQANQPQLPAKVAVQERMTVTLSGIREMSGDEVLSLLMRIIDVVKDAGVEMGPEPQSMLAVQLRGAKPSALATFKLSDAALLRKKAYAEALKQARAKAEGLAELAGVELGAIVSISESASKINDDSDKTGVSNYLALLGVVSSNQPNTYTSAEFQNIPVTVNLTVQFDIAGKR